MKPEEEELMITQKNEVAKETLNDANSDLNDENSNNKDVQIKSPTKNTDPQDITEAFRKSQREKRRPKYLEKYTVLALGLILSPTEEILTAAVESYVENILKTYADMINREDKETWYKAANEERNSIT